MNNTPYIDDTIFAQIMDIRESGEVNMLDCKAVFELAVHKSYNELADLSENSDKSAYHE